MKRLLFSLAGLSMLMALGLAPPAVAAAASKTPVVIDAFNADPGNQLTPGTEIVFTVEGTPKGKASVRISGIPRTINLKEVDSGSYEGTYTIRSRDKIAPNATARASLKARGRTATAELQFKAAPPVAAAPAPAPAPEKQAAGAPTIERFSVAPVERIEPGADLRFTVLGTPGARATVGIQGVNRDIAMKEVKPGHYEAVYTVRKLDHFPPSGNIVARLESGGQTTRMRLNQSLLVAAKPPVLRNLSPRDGDTVPLGPVSIAGTIDDSGGVGIDPKSVRILVDGRDVTGRSTVTSDFFTYRTEPGPGTHQVQVSAQDTSGNAIRHTWRFTVAQQGGQTGLPLQILSHPNNAQIPGGPTEIRGRTAPNAQIDVKVTQTAAVAGLFGVNQEVLNQTVRADANGNFAFRFQPQFSVPGSRYEVSMKARTDQASRDLQLVLFQQK
jgi:hypothetical protein